MYCKESWRNKTKKISVSWFRYAQKKRAGMLKGAKKIEYLKNLTMVMRSNSACEKVIEILF